MYTFDLDSLVYMSTEILEGEIVSNLPANRMGPVQVKVSTVYKGSIKENQVLSLKCSVYRRPDRSDLRAGDRLFFVLARSKKSRNGVGEKAAEFYAVESGLRFVHDGRVLTFRQSGNPGPFVAVEPKSKDDMEAPPLAVFKKQLAHSLRVVPEYVASLEQDRGMLDSERLLMILGRLPKPTSGHVMSTSADELGKVAATKLALLGDPQLLLKAQSVCQANLVYRKLGPGFGTAKGRDFLLAKVEDPKLDMELRVRCATNLRFAGPIYKSNYADKFARDHVDKGEFDVNNSLFVTRIARAANENLHNEALCLALLDCLEDYVRVSRPDDIDKQLSSDLQGALTILQEMPSKKLPPSIQQRLERIDPTGSLKAYKQASIKRPKNSICELEGSAEARTLTLVFKYDASNFGPSARLHTSLILTQEGSREKRVIPLEWVLPGGLKRSIGANVKAPADLPPGKYKVFAEVSDGKKIIATTEPFVVEL
jgi:hypothetical protein